MTNTTKKGEYVKFKNYERKIKLLFMIYGEEDKTTIHDLCKLWEYFSAKR